MGRTDRQRGDGYVAVFFAQVVHAQHIWCQRPFAIAFSVTKVCSLPYSAKQGRIFVSGAARMVNAFDAVDKVREVLSVLERQLVVVSLIRDVLDRGLSVAIGSETGVEPLAECSLVVAPYEVEGRQVGTVGVLGPTRLNYPQALSAVAVVSRRLGDRLSEG